MFTTIRGFIYGAFYSRSLSLRIIASKEIGPEVNAEKIKSMIMSRDQIAEQDHSIKTCNKSPLFTFLPMKMEQIECSEMSAYKIQTPGNHPEENIQHVINRFKA
jgi:hypothetical protein